MKNLKERENTLLAEIRSSKLSVDELLQPYELPSVYKKLKELQINNQITTQSIGFELWLDRPITPAPKDLIPFAITGGDSCYFAFITDYGSQLNLESCSIAFVSPTDFDDSRPQQSNFLIAKNIKEFLALMISLEYGEHLRYQDVYKYSINEILKESIAQFKEEQTDAEIELKDNTKNRLKSEFQLSEIDDFYTHFESVKVWRNQSENLPTLDGLNIRNENEQGVSEALGETIAEYLDDFKNQSKQSILVSIRNAPYKFSYTDSEYEIYKTALVEVYKNLNLKREQRIQEFEIEMDRLFSEWMNVRKQILEDER